jgi:hypothetical protein
VKPSSRFLDSRALSASHPLRSPRKSPSCPREDRPRRATRSVRDGPCGFSLGQRERYFSPTSATNSLTRAPVNRSTPESKAFALGHSTVFTILSRRHLSASLSQVEAGLTARLQLRPYRSLFIRGETGPRWGAAPRRCQPRAKPMTDLWRSLSPPDSILVTQEVFRTLEPLPTLFASTKKACSARSAFSRQVLGDPLYASFQTRHRALDFATEEPASEVFSRPHALALNR